MNSVAISYQNKFELIPTTLLQDVELIDTDIIICKNNILFTLKVGKTEKDIEKIKHFIRPDSPIIFLYYV